MTSKFYELIEHTADIGLRVFGKDAEGLFTNAATGMFDIIAKKKAGSGQPKTKARFFDIELKARNREELLIAWLSELLSLSDVHKIIFNRAHIQQLTPKKIKARIGAERITEHTYQLNTEIKAVTYHQLKIAKRKGRLQAEVIFDV